ncbi:MAG: hypothetical protein DRN59_00460 [Thaumarchaeota archaeon]|nr:MAG: hypothetical protein DRN59_00460 [Nitrososphaerota archaeon]
MWREKIICPHCGHETYKAPFCTFCGKPLNPDEASMSESSEEAQRENQSREEVEKQIPEISEERKLVEQLSNYLNWRHKLIEVFLNGEASPDIFLDVYKEYREKIQAINSKRLEIINSLQQRMNELTNRLEQLKVRHEVGEISDRQYITDKLSIDRELSKLKPKLNLLHNIFDVKLADIPSYEEKIRNLRNEISEKGQSMGLSEESVKMIVEDLDQTLESLKDLLELHKKLKKELDKLELRYKIGELTEEEYQAAKQKIERQMQLY